MMETRDFSTSMGMAVDKLDFIHETMQDIMEGFRDNGSLLKELREAKS